MPLTPANPAPLEITIRPQTPTAVQTFWNGEAPDFQDVLDTVNPLQHIPVVSTLYQSLTGDMQSVGAKLAGGAIFGGPIGFIAALFDTIVQNATGSDVMGNVMAAIEGNPVPALDKKAFEVAAATPPDHVSPNRRAAYNAYLNAQSLLA